MERERKPLNIKAKLVIYIVISTVVMLAVLWVFNIGFLALFYKESAKGDSRRTAKVVENNLNIEDSKFDKLIKRLSTEHLLNIAVINSEGVKKSSYTIHANTITADRTNLASYFNSAKENDGNYEEPDDIIIEYSSIDYVHPVPANKPVVRSFIIQSTIIKDANGNEYAVIIEAPSASTKRELDIAMKQLGIVSAILIVMALATSYVIGQVVALPIIDLNESAKYLTSADTEIGFRGKGYSEIIELQDTLNYARDEIQAIDKYRKELIANISHDLRTPLTLIKGYNEMMRDMPGEATPENFSVIVGEIDRLTRLVSDMLDLSKFDRNVENLNLEYFDIVKEMRELYERHSKLLANLGYKMEFIAEDKKAFVYADQVKILQVVYNLINNAVTYCGEDKLVILKQSSGKDRVAIEVIDNGEGIDVDILPRIWDRYYKSEKAHKRADVGTGLGLSIVKSVMNLHPGGKYGVLTSKGEGSTFYIELPKIKESDIEE